MKTSPQELFLQANQLYEQKEYAKAQQRYEQIPKKSAAVWYNIGNCAYHNNKELDAILYWKRAHKNGDSALKAQCIYNCQAICKKMGLPTYEKNILSTLSPLALQILFFSTFSVFLVMHRRLWTKKRILALTFLCGFFAVIGSLTYAAYRAGKQAHALVMHDNSPLLAGTDDQFHRIAVLPKGSEVTILARKSGWKKISWAGLQGWVQETMIEEI